MLKKGAGRRGGLLQFAYRQWKGLLAIAGTVILLGGVTLGLALTWRPAWYRPLRVDHQLLRADKAALVGLQDRISAALNAGQPVEFVLDEAQVNRWIAAREQIWPDSGGIPALLEEAQVRFTPDGIRVGVLVRGWGFGTAASVLFDVSPEAEELQISTGGARAGAVPVPARLLLGRLLRNEHGSDGIQVADGKLRMANVFVWPNGRRELRLDGVRASLGRLRVRLVPIRGRRAGRR